MEFYQDISKYYDLIFPLQKPKWEFVSSFSSQEKKPYLDVGCGTGELVKKMSDYSIPSIGIDLSEDMIQEAKRNNKQNGQFFVADMSQLGGFFKNNNFGLISCLGNTLVHLANEDQIKSFLKTVYEKLRSGGHCLIQIVNYDMILEYSEKALPVLDNEKIKFERFYEHITADHLTFKTILTDKLTDKSYQQEVQLFPLTSIMLDNILIELGFKEMLFYDDFLKTPWTGKKMGMVVSAKK